MSEIEILRKFKDTVISFLDELISQFPQEPELVIFRIFLKDRIPIVEVINYFVRKVLPLKKMVQDRNEDFFLNHCTLMEDINNQQAKGKINHFKKLWRSPTLDDEDKEIVWQWFDIFITLSEKYQKNMINTQKI